MTKYDALALRNKLYSAVSSLGTAAALESGSRLDIAYDIGSQMLDEIDAYCSAKGYIENNQTTPKQP